MLKRAELRDFQNFIEQTDGDSWRYQLTGNDRCGCVRRCGIDFGMLSEGKLQPSVRVHRPPWSALFGTFEIGTLLILADVPSIPCEEVALPGGLRAVAGRFKQ